MASMGAMIILHYVINNYILKLYLLVLGTSAVEIRKILFASNEVKLFETWHT